MLVLILISLGEETKKIKEDSVSGHDDNCTNCFCSCIYVYLTSSSVEFVNSSVEVIVLIWSESFSFQGLANIFLNLNDFTPDMRVWFTRNFFCLVLKLS